MHFEPSPSAARELASVVVTEQFPDASELAPEGLLIFDEILNRLGDDALDAWIAQFPRRYPVRAGEPLKDLAAFPQHVENITQIAAPLAASRASVLALGGGSVGDFAGFFASVWKRGVGLVQIPSTWLAAIDSAHGGKNALNIGLAKNQIGTFAFPKRVYLSRPLLFLQPEARVQEAFGELAKIAIIDGGPWVAELSQSPHSGGALLWQFLGEAVAAKNRVVARDPFERLGIRHALNLGHTVGHVLETVHHLPHGLAVAQGMYFALHFSHQRGLLAPPDLAHLCEWLQLRFGLVDRRAELQPMPQPLFMELLTQDKKRSAETRVRFIFVRDIGRIEISDVELSELLGEAIRQGYVAA